MRAPCSCAHLRPSNNFQFMNSVPTTDLHTSSARRRPDASHTTSHDAHSLKRNTLLYSGEPPPPGRHKRQRNKLGWGARPQPPTPPGAPSAPSHTRSPLAAHVPLQAQKGAANSRRQQRRPTPQDEKDLAARPSGHAVPFSWHTMKDRSILSIPQGTRARLAPQCAHAARASHSGRVAHTQDKHTRSPKHDSRVHQREEDELRHGCTPHDAASSACAASCAAASLSAGSRPGGIAAGEAV